MEIKNGKKPISEIQKKLLLDLIQVLKQYDTTIQGANLTTINKLTTGRAHFIIQDIYTYINQFRNSKDNWKEVIKFKENKTLY